MIIAKDVRQFLKQFERTLTVLAREGRHVELEAKLDDFQKLLTAWLDVAPPGIAPPERFRLFAIIDQFGGPLEIKFRDIADSATLSGDTSTVVILADHLLRAAFACLHQHQPRLMEEFLNSLTYFYYQCVKTPTMGDAIRDRLDSGLHSLFTSVQSTARNRDIDDSVAINEKIPFLNTALRFALSLTNAAIRNERDKDASFFTERIFEYRKYNIHHNDRFETKPVSEGIRSTFDYVAVVLVGWSLHILQENVCKNTEAASTVLAAGLSQVPAMPMLIAEWELLRGTSWHEGEIDARLGIANWDVQDWNRDYRTGISVTSSGRPDWIRLGLRAAALCTNTRFLGDPSRIFAESPKRFVWDVNQEREAFAKLADDKWLNIPQKKRETCVDDVMVLIESRARSGDSDYLRYVLESPLSQERVSELSSNAIENFEKYANWQKALRACGIGDQPPKTCPLSKLWGIWIPREYLLDDNNWAPGFGEQLGKETATREAMELIHLIETRALEIEPLVALADLQEVVRTARRKMSMEEFKPNALILPREDRFASALFGKPLWEVEGNHEYGEVRMMIWEKLRVLQFPYTNPKSILLIDSRCLLSNVNAEKNQVRAKIWIDEAENNEEIIKLKETAIAALESNDSILPASSSIQVLARMSAIPQLAIADIKAAVAINIENSDGGFALPPDSDLYHRPLCPDIEYEDAKYVLRLQPDSERKPCQTCRPDRWNAEGRRGNIRRDK